jgi:hypothetical protein
MTHAFAPLFSAVLLALSAVLVRAIVIALGVESVFVAGPRIAQDPWTWVTIVDLYLGFLVFGGYLVAREGRVLRALPWLVALLALGNLASAAYVVWAFHRGGYRVRALIEPAGPQASRLEVDS